MHVAVDLCNLSGRRLIAEDSDVVLYGDYRNDMESWTHAWEGTQPDLIAQPRELAALAARELFLRFGLNLSTDILTRIQERIRR